MTRSLLYKSLALLSLPALSGTVLAGNVTYNFDTDPTGTLVDVFGSSVWRPTGGHPGVGGNTGYLSVTDAINGQNGTIIFKDIDAGYVVTAFTFSCSLRTGGGTATPADGYSVSFARSTDPVITSGNGSGFSGGAAEEGTTTGISVGLDEYDNGNGDVIGISVRVDGVQVLQSPLPVFGGPADNVSSLQSGPANQPLDGEFNVAEHTFVPLVVKLDADGTLDVTYKGAVLLNNLPTTYLPSVGQIVLGGRTGGLNSHHHLENVSLVTTLSTVPVVDRISLGAAEFRSVIIDGTTNTIDPTKGATLTIDGTAVGPVTVSKTGLRTTASFTAVPPAFFAAGVRSVVLTLRDAANNPYTFTRNVTIAPYSTLDSAWRAAAGQINTTTPGFGVRIHQVTFDRGNNLPGPERQFNSDFIDGTTNTPVPNVADLTTATAAGGGFLDEGPLNWTQDGGQQGNFGGESPIPGIPGTTGSTDNIVGEVVAWLDLPAGVTRIGVNSDDGFTFSVGANPRDIFGRTIAGVFDGGRGAADTIFEVLAPTAGLYPIRLLWWEGGGGANLELFTLDSSGVRHLVNNAADPASRNAYAGITGQPALNAIPAISEMSPLPNLPSTLSKDRGLIINLVDGVKAVNDASIQLTVDAVVRAPIITNDGIYTTITAPAPAAGWDAGVHNVSLTYTSGAPAVSRTQTFTFKTVGLNYVWESGGDDPTNITDPTNWVGDLAPPNNGTNLNVPAGALISFATNNMTIPDSGGRQINLAAGAQILTNKGGGGDLRVNAQVNAQGLGPDGNGFFFVDGGSWGMPNNITLVANGTTTANGNRLRMNDGPNRLDLAGFTLTTKGNSENNFVNTNISGAAGSRMVLQNFTAFEGGTRFDPNVTVELAPGNTASSWGGQGARRAAAMVLNNNTRIETRFDDDDMTFSGPLTVATGNTGILQASIHGAGNPDSLNGQDLRLNILGPLAGAGKFRKDGGGSLILGGTGTNTGGLDINGVGSTVLANDTAAGTGPIAIIAPATLLLSNAGGQEYVDNAGSVDALLDVANKTLIDPAISGVHSRQSLGDNRRITFTGKFNNPANANVLYTFAEQYDDSTFVEIDGTMVLTDNAWNLVKTGQISLAPGSHDFRVSVRNGGGGVGPNNEGGNPGWNQVGLGYSTTQPLDDGLGGSPASIVVTDYIKLQTNYEIYQPVNRMINNAIVVNTLATLSTAAMNGYDATLSGNISGFGSLTVAGSPNYTTDELILTGVGSFSGPISVTNGRLVINGNFSTATGLVNVGAGSSLGGTGTVGGATTVSGGISPGSGGIGTLNVAANTTWNAGSSWGYQLGAGSTSDRLAITGNFTKGVGTGYAFNFSNTGGAGTYTLVTWTGSSNFVAGDFAAANLAAGTTGTFAIVDKSLVLNAAAGGGGGGYAAWSATAFPAGTSAANRTASVDFDQDGIVNLMEYALNTNPGASTPGPAPEVVTVGASSFLQIRWTRPNDRTDLTTIGEVSVNLTPSSNWVTGPANVTTTITPAGAGLEQVVIRSVQAIGTGPRRFIRAKVSLLP